MQCQICHEKTATIHLTEISNGMRTEVHFCEQCAVKQGIAAAGQISVNELLSTLLPSQPSDEELLGPPSAEIACPNCGITLKQFRKRGVLGCPNDYVVFEKALRPLIEKAHNGKSSHCGKVPAHAPQETKDIIESMSLKDQLEDAIKREDYELAARLHQKISQLKQHPESENTGSA